LPTTEDRWAALDRRRRRLKERAIGGVLFAFSIVSILTTVGIVLVLAVELIDFFLAVSPWEFLTGTRWAPLIEPRAFGILPLLSGSLLVAVGAAVVAIPLGLLIAIYLSEYAPTGMRRVVKPALEILAGIPTVVYGYFALTFVTPLLRTVVPQTDIFNAASAGIVVGIMVMPMVSSLSEDAMTAVPDRLRKGAYALGATRYEVATRTVLPAALSGVVASFILAFSRAIGETMVVTIAAGGSPKLTLNPFTSIETMTAYIIQVSRGATPFGGIEYETIFAVGAVLFAITFALNGLAARVLDRFRAVYR
jgi:phosphate transport system permease protein